MSDTIARWLGELDLGQYVEAFEENAIGPEHLPDLDHALLNEIGVRSVGHRMTILKAAARFAESTYSSQSQPSTKPFSDPTGVFTGDAERRQLSVMFCDLVGSTALSERLDLEAYRELLGIYQDAAREAIERYDGYIARYMGDGLLVYFGYPVAHEDDAERAVRAGLDVVKAVAEKSPIGESELRVRVGVATGPVVAGDIVGEGASEERAVLGETPNLAARLQGLATPNGVIISESTKNLVEGRFELDPLKPQRVKGLREPVCAFHAKATRSASRFDAATTRGMSAFVGRRSELQLLIERWNQAKEGEGQVVVLSGEAGVGKSRILREFREHLSQEEYTLLRYQCSPYGVEVAFSPIIEHLQSRAGFTTDDSDLVKLDKLERMLTLGAEGIDNTAALLAALLSLPGDRYPPMSMTPQRQKVETIAVLVAQIQGLAQQHSVLLVVEDAHWIDASTLETFNAMIGRIQTLPAMIVVTHRPEFDSPWKGFGHVTHHSLNRLSRGDGKRLSEQVSGGRALPGVVLEQILDRTDGVPLFVEELTKTVLEAGFLREKDGAYVLDGPLPPVAIPMTVRDSLMARLDHLAPVKIVAQAAACIGREFTSSLLARVLHRASIEDELNQLLDSGLVFRRGSGEQEAYIFKHALVQDTAYESLLVTSRRKMHARIAELLEGAPGVEPGILARHFSGAGLVEKAGSYYLAAGRRALSVSALPEAAAELEKGLREIKALPASTLSDRLELDLRAALGATRIAYRGWSYSSVADAYVPAFELAEKLNDEQALGCIIWGLCVHYWTRAEFPETHYWLAKLETASDKSTNSELSAVRDMTAGCQYFWEAQYEKAYRYTAHIRATYEESRHAPIAAYTNHDPLTFSLLWAGSLLQWIVGNPDLGLELVNEAHEIARRIGHPFNSVFALTAGSECLLMRGDTEAVIRCCDEAERIIDEAALGDFAQHVLVDNWRGRACTHAGDFESGYRLTNLATKSWCEAQGKICSAMFWSDEAIALGSLGRTREALVLIEAAINHCRDTGDRYMEPEVLRIKAELMLAGDESTSDSVEGTLLESLRLARDHGARSWELRTATSLARLWHTNGKQSAAESLLAPVYDWFTQGFDTTDLRQAKALLEEIS